jgi:hypothetical protein
LSMPRIREEILNKYEHYTQSTYYTNALESYDISSFSCGIDEYDAFLKEDALNFKALGISNTYLLICKESRRIIALELNEQKAACRLLIVDSDIQYDKGNLDFYKNCGFVENEQKNSNALTVSMRADIYKDLIINS